MSKAIQTVSSKRVVEIMSFTYEGISVLVSIDYQKRTVSLVESAGNGAFKGKKWLFEGRTPDYFSSWQRILDAMKYAIAQAHIRLDEQPSVLEEAFMELAKNNGNV